jgi:carbamoyltransferase
MTHSMTLILGVNAYHGDAAACLVDGDRVLAAAEEERFRRVKHYAGFPARAIEYCLAEVGASPADLDHVAVNRDPRASWLRRLGFVIRHRPDLSKILDRLRTRRQAGGVGDDLRALLGPAFRGRVHGIEHHLAHLASAALVSPFTSCVAVSVDQFGDFASSAGE